MKTLLSLTLCSLVIAGCDVQANLKLNSPTPATSSTAAEQSGRSGSYKFQYRVENDRAVALFLEPMLPRNDAIFVQACRDVIRAAFNAEVSARYDLVANNKSAKKSVRFQDRSFFYLALPVKEDSGEIHSIVIVKKARS